MFVTKIARPDIYQKVVVLVMRVKQPNDTD